MVNGSIIRKSVSSDRECIYQLMCMCFGDKNNLEPYENLDDRYYLYFENGVLVAMTGLISSSEYDHPEVDWTCTHPEFRHRGYMQALFTEMLGNVKESVYCSCWRLSNSDKVNLYTLMSLFGFKEVIRSRVHWKVPFNCFRDYSGGCVCCTGVGCECYEDLFLRKAEDVAGK